MDFGSIVRKSGRIYGSNTAVIYGDRKLTYADLYERSCKLVNGLAANGVKPGDRVCTLEENSLESVEQLTGVALGGFVRSPMYTQNTPDVTAYMLNLVGARALIIQDKYWKDLAGHMSEAPSVETVIVRGDTSDGALAYDDVLAKASGDDPMVRVDPDDVHIIRFSAGTTGRPKGIYHTMRNWLGMGNEIALMLPRIEESDAQLIAGPMSHASGLNVWPMVSHGGAQVIMPAFDPGLFLELVERERCTMSILVPTMIQILANHPDAKKRDLSSLKAVFYGASPIAEQTLIDAHNVWGKIMYQIYGQSESLPVTIMTPRHHMIDGNERERKWLRSAGRPTPNSFVRILDDDGNDLPTGEVGEITSMTPGQMTGIWNDDQATKDRFVDGGWVRTRDIGYVDEDGFVYIADRKEDMIISGGFNIWPAEIENALYAHPSVLEAAVVGVPHEKWGETPKAVVVLKEGEAASEDDLIGWCREKIGSVKKPTSVVFQTESLPKNSAGKMLRRTIRERYWSTEDQRVHGA